MVLDLFSGVGVAEQSCLTGHIVGAMDLQAVEALNEDLTEFTRDIFKYLGYQGQRRYGQQYLRGLMLDGRRKSVEPMASRLGLRAMLEICGSPGKGCT